MTTLGFKGLMSSHSHNQRTNNANCWPKLWAERAESSHKAETDLFLSTSRAPCILQLSVKHHSVAMQSVIQSVAFFIQLSRNEISACLVIYSCHTTVKQCWLQEQSKNVKQSIAVSGNHLTATGNHMLYGITQCYLPPGSGDFPAFTPAKLVLNLATPEGCKAELT